MAHRHHLAMSVGLALAVSFAYSPHRVQACSYGGPEPHQTDKTEELYDNEPPGQVVEVSVSIGRGTGPIKQPDCGHETGECDGIGFVYVTLEPPGDDRTPVEQMGYLFELVDGEPPSAFLFPHEPVRPIYETTTFPFDWDDGAEQEQESFSFRFTVRAVDLAGNVGVASDPIRVSDSGTGGCTATGMAMGSLWPLLLVTLVIRLAHARRRRPHLSAEAEQ